MIFRRSGRRVVLVIVVLATAMNLRKMSVKDILGSNYMYAGGSTKDYLYWLGYDSPSTIHKNATNEEILVENVQNRSLKDQQEEKDSDTIEKGNDFTKPMTNAQATTEFKNDTDASKENIISQVKREESNKALNDQEAESIAGNIANEKQQEGKNDPAESVAKSGNDVTSQNGQRPEETIESDKPNSTEDQHQKEFRVKQEKDSQNFDTFSNFTTSQAQSTFTATNEENLTNRNNNNNLHNDNTPPTNSSFQYTPLAPGQNNLWDDSPLLPGWMKEYFAWHAHVKQNLTHDNWQYEARYLIPMAQAGQRSGGMTDRLRPLPAYLRLAAQTQRVLLLHWGRPCSLQEFLLPPKGGLDWRVPDYMVEVVESTKKTQNWNPIEHAARSKAQLVVAKYQSWNYGEIWYKEQAAAAGTNETDLYQAFRDIWKVLFTPSPPVAQRIHDNFVRMNLQPGEFATAHLRVLYAIQDRPLQKITAITQNALNCASNLRPGGPFFVASDSSDAVQVAIQYGRSKNVTVVAANHPHIPLHVDRHDITPESNITAADFYDGFVDMFLMAATRCVAVGPGGFARWGHLLGFNDTCVIHHFGRKSVHCDWKNTTNAADEVMPGYPSIQAQQDAQQQPYQTPQFPEPRM